MFSQLSEETLLVCQCPQTCSIIESVIPHASCANIKVLMEAFSQDWIQACTDKCSSHVVQKAITAVPNFITEKLKGFEFSGEADDSDETYLIQSVLGLTECCLENIEDCLTNLHMSHILRALFQVLGGVCVRDSENVQKSKKTQNYGKRFREPDGMWFFNFFQDDIADDYWNKG